MFPKINVSETKAWQQLQHHFDTEMRPMHLRSLFSEDGDRFRKFSLQTRNFMVDFSKNLISHKTLDLLLQLAEECKVKEAISAMFSGEAINETEKRPVLHVALRNFHDSRCGLTDLMSCLMYSACLIKSKIAVRPSMMVIGKGTRENRSNILLTLESAAATLAP